MNDTLAVEASVEAVGRPLRCLRDMFVWKFLRGGRLFVVMLLHRRFTGQVEIFCNGQLRFRNGLFAYCRGSFPFQADGIEMCVERFARGFVFRIEQVPFEHLQPAPAHPDPDPLRPQLALSVTVPEPPPASLSRITITEFVVGEAPPDQCP